MKWLIKRFLFPLCAFLAVNSSGLSQIDVNHVISIGRNALYFNDYVVSIGYFNQVIATRPWLAEPYLYRAIAKVSLDDYVGAEVDAGKSIELNPYISRTYLVRGIALQNTNRFEEAIKAYEQGLTLAPDNGQMRFNKAVAELRTKRLKEANRSIDTLLIYNPRFNEAYALKASVALEAADTTQALLHIEKAINVDPTMSIPYKLKASIAAARNEWLVGIDNLGRAIELEPNADLYAERAIMRYQTNNLKGALQDYTKAIELNAKHTTALHNRALLRQQVGEKRLALEDWTHYLLLEPTNYIARYNRALLSIDLGMNYQQAMQDLNAVLKQYPSFSEGFMQRSILRFKMGDRRGADADYRHAGELVSNTRTAQSALAQARLNVRKETKQKTDESIDKYALLIEELPSSAPDTRYSSRDRGRVQDRHVSVEQKPIFYLTFYSVVDSSHNPLNRANYYAERIDTYNKQEGNPILRLQSEPQALNEKQIAELSELLKEPEKKGQANYYLRRGIIHSLLQDYEQAILDYNRVLTLDGRNELALFARSIASMRYTEAQQKGKETGLDLRSSEAKIGQAVTINKPTTLGIMPSALQDLGQLQMINPNFAYVYYNRGVLYAHSGERVQAINDYTRAIELEPRLSEAYYNRGLLLLAEGKILEGTQDLSKAGELGISDAYSIIKRMQ